MSTRRPHYLQTIKRTSVPTRMVFLDCESFAVQDEHRHGSYRHTYRTGVAHYVRAEADRVATEDWWTSTDPDTFWSFLQYHTELYHPTWVFMFNASYVTTLMKFWNKIEDGGIQFFQNINRRYSRDPKKQSKDWHGLIVIESPPFMLRCRFSGTQKEIVIVDVQNYYHNTLAEIAASVGVSMHITPSDDSPTELWTNKCTRDVAIIEAGIIALTDLVREEKMGNFSLTIAAQAMQAFRARHLRSNFEVHIHDNMEVLRIERASYYGGIAMPYFIGRVVTPADDSLIAPPSEPGGANRNGPVYVVDATAFYPAIMREHKFPTLLTQVSDTMSLAQLVAACAKNMCVAEVKLKCRGYQYPVRIDGKVIHAEGEYWTTLPHPELMVAISRGDIISIGRVCEYQSAAIFTTYVLRMWELRKKYKANGDKAGENCIKSLMNSLFGKFSQRSNQWELCPDVDAPYPVGYFYVKDALTAETKEYRSIGWEVQERLPQGEGDDSSPVISACVTSYGRIKLREWMDIAGQSNVLYADTDCLHVTERGYANLVRAEQILTGEMGWLRLASKHRTAMYRGPKSYTIDGTNVISGLKVDAKMTSEGVYEQSVWTSIATILERREFGYVATESRQFALNNEPCQGRVDSTGTVHPPVLSMSAMPKISYDVGSDG